MKVALVTGAAKRLGRSIALSLGQQGYFTWIHYRHSKKEALETLFQIKQAGGAGEIISANIQSQDEVSVLCKTVLEKSPTLDVLVNNVGEYATGNLLQFSLSSFESIIQTNLMGSYYLIQKLQNHLTPTGSILNIGYTGLESLAAVPQTTAYTISKTGLLLLTKSYASLLAPRGVRVNMVSPGQQENSVDLPQNLSKIIPMNRAGTTQDLIQAIEFLISPQASYITGQNLEISGGFMMSLQSHLKND